MTLAWVPCDPDAVMNVVFVAMLTLTGWTACPTLEDPEQLCPTYNFSGWANVTETPSLTIVYELPTPAPGSVTFVTIEGKDAAGNLSPPEDSENDCV